MPKTTAGGRHDETLLTISQKYLQSYLKSEQVDAWIDQLRSGRPLGPPAFRYKAQIRAGDGPRRLEIEGISKDLDALSLEDLGKIAGRIADLNADLRKALLEKHAANSRSRRMALWTRTNVRARSLFREIGLFLEGEETAEAKEAAMAAEAAERRNAADEQLTKDAPEASEADGTEAELAAVVAEPPAAVRTVPTATGGQTAGDRHQAQAVAFGIPVPASRSAGAGPCRFRNNPLTSNSRELHFASSGVTAPCGKPPSTARSRGGSSSLLTR